MSSTSSKLVKYSQLEWISLCNGKKSNEIYDISSYGKDTVTAKHPFFGDMSNEEGFEEIIPSNVMKDGVNSGFEEDKDHQEEAGYDNADVEDKDSGDEHLIVGETITQPITSNAPLQSSHNAPQIEISSRSNLGTNSTVAGLDMEWNHVF
ncbi:hypothetical protein QYF36_007415 [Acer negundo]|nr:hypothetical protein QYF36_007415 [Acer negundo]